MFASRATIEAAGRPGAIPRKLTYDQDAEAFYARFAPDGTRIAETKEVAPNVTIDLDDRGNLVGFEVLHVRLRKQRRADHKQAAESL